MKTEKRIQALIKLSKLRERSLLGLKSEATGMLREHARLERAIEEELTRPTGGGAGQREMERHLGKARLGASRATTELGEIGAKLAEEAAMERMLSRGAARMRLEKVRADERGALEEWIERSPGAEDDGQATGKV